MKTDTGRKITILLTTAGIIASIYMAITAGYTVHSTAELDRKVQAFLLYLREGDRDGQKLQSRIEGSEQMP